MDVKEVVQAADLNDGSMVEVTGWLVDRHDGLYVLGDHFPEDYDFPVKLRVVDGNIIYSILQQVPSLGGGGFFYFIKQRLKVFS